MKLYISAHSAYKTKISCCLDNPILKKDFGNWSEKLSENKVSGNKEIFYPDWEYIEIEIKKDHIHLYIVIPPEMCAKQSCGNHQ